MWFVKNHTLRDDAAPAPKKKAAADGFLRVRPRASTRNPCPRRGNTACSAQAVLSALLLATAVSALAEAPSRSARPAGRDGTLAFGLNLTLFRLGVAL